MSAALDVRDHEMPPRDWQGHPLDTEICSGCDYAALQASGGCQRGRSCMQDVHARRIERFFRNQPSLAREQLAHPYLDVRAIAVRHADLFHLTPLIADPDETVRMQLALRLPKRLLLRLRNDPHREVRIRVAHRLELAELDAMVRDPEPDARQRAAEHALDMQLPEPVHG